MFTLRYFLLRHHGKINRILLSQSSEDCPTDSDEAYDKWYKDTNKDFEVNIDLQHTSQTLECFKEILPYLDFEVTCWSMYEKNGEIILDVDL